MGLVCILYGYLNTLRPSDACIHQLINHHWFRQWLVAAPVPSHYLNQWWNVVNWTLGNKFQWHLNWNSYIFVQENASENVVWKIAAILSQPQCVKLQQPLRIPLAVEENLTNDMKSKVAGNGLGSIGQEKTCRFGSMSWILLILSPNYLFYILNVVNCWFLAI